MGTLIFHLTAPWALAILFYLLAYLAYQGTNQYGDRGKSFVLMWSLGCLVLFGLVFGTGRAYGLQDEVQLSALLAWGVYFLCFSGLMIWYDIVEKRTQRERQLRYSIPLGYEGH